MLENKMVIPEQWHGEREPWTDNEPTRECPLCGREIAENDMIYAVCDQCLADNKAVATALEYGAERTTKVSINGFLAYQFDADEINDILTAALSDLFKTDHREFLNDDEDDFAMWLQKRNAAK